jgi:hypothetical protein
MKNRYGSTADQTAPTTATIANSQAEIPSDKKQGCGRAPYRSQKPSSGYNNTRPLPLSLRSGAIPPRFDEAVGILLRAGVKELRTLFGPSEIVNEMIHDFFQFYDSKLSA